MVSDVMLETLASLGVTWVLSTDGDLIGGVTRELAQAAIHDHSAIPVDEQTIRLVAPGERWATAAATVLAAATMALAEAAHQREEAYAARLQVQNRELRQAHGMRAGAPLEAVGTLVRGRKGKRRRVVARGRGNAPVGAAECGEFWRPAMRLADRR